VRTQPFGGQPQVALGDTVALSANRVRSVGLVSESCTCIVSALRSSPRVSGGPSTENGSTSVSPVRATGAPTLAFSASWKPSREVWFWMRPSTSTCAPAGAGTVTTPE